MKNFIQAELLLIFLMITSAVNAPFPNFLILSAGLLMIWFSIRSLSEKITIVELLLQLLLSWVFCLSSAGIFSFLIFTEVRTDKSNKWRSLLPALIYAGTALIKKHTGAPEIVLNLLVLLAISLLLSLLNMLVVDYLEVKHRTAHAVSITAVNELYEKKLNRELTIRNYLADRNARLEERETISRSIHNSVGHSITAAVMAMDAADLLFDTNKEAAREKMNAANGRMRESLQSIRHAVRVLDTDNPYVSISDFQRELQTIADNFTMDTTLLIRMDFPIKYPELSLPHEHTEFLTGALQELLTNGVRHGNANVFTVRLTADSSHIRLQVTDNGTSDFNHENEDSRIKNGFGLKKLISYTKRCGGAVRLSHGMGLTVEVTLPVIKRL